MKEKFPYFYKLICINKLYFKGDNLRIKNYNDLEEINNLIYILYQSIKDLDDINSLIEVVLNVTGKILYMQPFYDGNSRTLKDFIKSIFKSLKYDIEINENDYIIPILFEEEQCTEEELNFFKKKVFLKKEV